MKYFLMLLGISILALTSMTCHAPTEPPTGADTTSNDWTFTVNKLGDGNSSQLFDVSIVNDTLAYAVGAIYRKDSSGNFDPNAYNLAKWDGRNWQLLHLPFYIFWGQQFKASVPTQAIWAFNGSEIWIASSNSQIAVWNGDSETSVMSVPIAVNKLWAAGENEIYAAGPLGQLALYNGSTWQKVQSGTSLNFYDIYGLGGQVLAVASNPFSSFESEIVQLSGTNATTISDNPITGSLMGVWFVPGQQYYVVGSGVYEKKTLSDASWSADAVDSSQTFMQGVRGNAANDVFVVGSFGQIWHFNGKTWRSYLNQTAVQNGGYGSVAVKGTLVIAVGQDNPYAVAAIGRR